MPLRSFQCVSALLQGGDLGLKRCDFVGGFSDASTQAQENGNAHG